MINIWPAFAGQFVFLITGRSGLPYHTAALGQADDLLFFLSDETLQAVMPDATLAKTRLSDATRSFVVNKLTSNVLFAES